MFGSFTWRGQQLLFLVVVHVRKHTTTSCVQVSDLLPTPRLWQVALAAIERNANAAVEPSLWQVMARASKCITDYHSMCLHLALFCCFRSAFVRPSHIFFDAPYYMNIYSHKEPFCTHLPNIWKEIGNLVLNSEYVLEERDFALAAIERNSEASSCLELP